jgi:transposase
MKKIGFPIGTKSEAERLIKETERASETKRLQCVLLGAGGLESSLIAPIVGYTPTHVRLIWKWFREGGFARLKGERRGQGRNRAHLSQEEEFDLLKPFEQEAQSGKLVTIKRIHQSHQKKLNKEIDITLTYRLLHRAHWRKIAPRGEHPKYNPKEADRFRGAIFPPGYDPYED